MEYKNRIGETKGAQWSYLLQNCAEAVLLLSDSSSSNRKGVSASVVCYFQYWENSKFGGILGIAKIAFVGGPKLTQNGSLDRCLSFPSDPFAFTSHRIS